MDGKQKGVLFTVLASLMFSVSPVFIKLVLDFTNIETMNVLFTAFSSLFFFSFFTFSRQKNYFRIIMQNWRIIAFMALFDSAGSLLLAYGILISGPTNTSFIIQFTLVFTILFGLVFLRERLSKPEILGLLVALVGLFILTYGTVQLEFLSTLAVLVAALLFATVNLLSKIFVKEIHPFSLAGGRSFFILLFLFTYALLLGKLDFAFPSITLGYSILGSLTGIVLSFILFFKALEVFEVSKTAAIRSAEPFLTAIFSFVILSLAPTSSQLIGGVFIVVGVVILSLTREKASRGHDLRYVSGTGINP